MNEDNRQAQRHYLLALLDRVGELKDLRDELKLTVCLLNVFYFDDRLELALRVHDAEQEWDKLSSALVGFEYDLREALREADELLGEREPDKLCALCGKRIDKGYIESGGRYLCDECRDFAASATAG